MNNNNSNYNKITQINNNKINSNKIKMEIKRLKKMNNS